MPFSVIARRRYGYYVAPFVARKNGTLGRRDVGHGGGWGNPITSEESRRRSGDPSDGGKSPPPLGPRSRPFYPLTGVASLTVARRADTLLRHSKTPLVLLTSTAS